KNKEMIEEYNESKLEFDKLMKEYNITKKRYLEQKSKKEKNDLDDKQYYGNYKIALSNYEKYIEVRDNKDSYNIINNLLMNNGLIDSILREKVLVKLKQTANNILKMIGSDPISIKMIDKKGNKYKTNEVIVTNVNETNASYCGYFERNVMEMIIRIAISRS